MKRKLAAVLLTLCMVLGMLPMSAFAAWTYNGTEYTPGSTIDVDGTTYYAQEGVTVPTNPAVGDTLTYYNADKTGTITLTWAEDAAEKVTVTFDVNAPEGATAPTAPEAQEIEKGGVLNSVPTLTLEGYTFKGWATTQTATAADVTAETTFAGTTTVYAVWEKVAVIDVTVESGTGKVDSITAEDIADVETVVIAVPDTTTEEVKTVEVSGSAFKTVADAANDGASAKALDVSTSTGKVALDAEVVKEIAALVTNDTDKVALKIEETTAPAEAPAGVGAAAKYVEVNLTVNDQPVATKDSQLKGTVTVSVKMDLTINTATQKLILWFIDGLTATEVEGASYANGMVSWATKHFSTYAAEVVDKPVTPPTGDQTGYYKLDVTAPGVSIVVSGSDTDANGYYKAGSTVTGTVTLAADEEIKSATLSDGTEVTINGANISFVMPAADVTLTVTVGKKTTIELKPITPDSSTEAGTKYTFEIAEGNVLVYQTKDSKGNFVIVAVNASATVSVEAENELTNAYECEMQGEVSSKDFDAFAFADGDHSEVNIVTTFQIKKA